MNLKPRPFTLPSQKRSVAACGDGGAGTGRRANRNPIRSNKSGRRALTYNFDPERWFDIERAALEKAFREGTLHRAAYDAALDSLQQKLDTLWDGLDGSYRLPE